MGPVPGSVLRDYSICGAWDSTWIVCVQGKRVACCVVFLELVAFCYLGVTSGVALGSSPGSWDRVVLGIEPGLGALSAPSHRRLVDSVPPPLPVPYLVYTLRT